MTIGEMLLLKESVELQHGIKNNIADMYTFGATTGGTLSIILDTPGDVLGEIGTGAKKL